jgi:hypothetical protein
MNHIQVSPKAIRVFITYLLVACITCLLVVQAYFFIDAVESKHQGNKTISKPLSSQKICKSAQKITVKVWRDRLWGSGIIMQRQGNVYTVVTNGHVLRDKDNLERSYSIQTADGKRHLARQIQRYDSEQADGTDIAILEFSANEQYIAEGMIRLAAVDETQNVVAAGFPIPVDSAVDRGFVCTEPAKLRLVLKQEMMEGYQIGYAIGVENGMSGGPLLDELGRVVGVNGKSIPAIFVNPDLYRYRDGRHVTSDRSRFKNEDQALTLLSSLSWAIPIAKINEVTAPNINLNLAIEPSFAKYNNIATTNTASQSAPGSVLGRLLKSNLPK